MASIQENLRVFEQVPDSVLAFLTSDPEAMRSIRERLHLTIESGNVKNEAGAKIGKEDVERIFNVVLVTTGIGKKFEIVEDKNTDRQTLNLFMAYYKSRLDVTPDKQRGLHKEAIFCLGMGSFTETAEGKKRYDNGNIEWLDRIYNNANRGVMQPSNTQSVAGAESDPDAHEKKPVTKRDIAERRRRATNEIEPEINPIPKPTDPDASQQPKESTAKQSEQIGLAECHVFVPLSLDDLINTPPLDFLTDNLIVRNSNNVMYAKAKTGKSFLCTHYAVCMVLGIPFLGMENHLERNIGYLNLDMNRRGFIERIKQVVNGIKPFATHEDITNILSRLKIIDRETIRSVRGHVPNFFKGEYLEDLQMFITSNDIEFCIIDTLTDVRSGSAENSNDDMAITMQNVEDFFAPLNCGSLTIHHAGKDGNLRGASAIEASTDLIIKYEKVNESDTHLKLSTPYVRYIDPFSLDVYADIKQETDSETGSSHAVSYMITTLDPEADTSSVIEYLKSVGNAPSSRRTIAKNAHGTYRTNCQIVDSYYAKGILDRKPIQNGYAYWIKPESGLLNR